METLANIDTLTGILNRRAFIEATKLINNKPRAFDKNHALLIIDIDNFKSKLKTRQVLGDCIVGGTFWPIATTEFS